MNLFVKHYKFILLYKSYKFVFYSNLLLITVYNVYVMIHLLKSKR